MIGYINTNKFVIHPIIVIFIFLISFGPCDNQSNTKPTDQGTQDVEALDFHNWDTNHGDCEPDGATRTIRAENLPHDDWVLISRWFTIANNIPTPQPSTIEVSSAFGKLERIKHYQCQDQICMAGSWFNTPSTGVDYSDHPCDIFERKTVQFNSGTGGVTQHLWTNDMVDIAFNQEHYGTP